MSTETGRPRRRYHKRRRAEREEETRRRITEAAVALHGSVGPARTTISAIAERAGVQRATVYRHFPDDAALFSACSAQWARDHPPPDPEPWTAMGDQRQRVGEALAAIYAYYAGAEAMLANVLRDAEHIPAVQAAEERRAYLAAVEELLAEGFPGGGERLRAMIALALDFATWRLLVRERGLAAPAAVELMARAVEGAGTPG